MSHSEQMRRVLNQLEVIGARGHGKKTSNDSKISDQTPTIRQLRENIMSTFNPKKVSTALNEARVQELKSQIYISKLVLEYYNSPQSLTEWSRKQREGHSSQQSVIEVRGIEARARRKEGNKGNLTRILKSNLKPTSDFFRVRMKKGGEPQEPKAGDKFIRHIHKLNKLSDSAIYQPPPARRNGKDIAWMQFKSDPDNFLIVIGSDGVAAIRPTKSETPTVKGVKYKIILANRDGVLGEREMRNLQAQAGEVETDPTIFKARGGMPSRIDDRNLDNLFDLCSEKIGTVEQNNIFFTEKAIQYIARQGGTELLKKEIGSIEHEKIKQRATRDQGPKANYNTARSQAIERIHPVLLKLANSLKSVLAASADRESTATAQLPYLNASAKIEKFIKMVEKAITDRTELPVDIMRVIDRAAAQASNSSERSDSATEFLASLGQKVTTKIDGQPGAHRKIGGRDQLAAFLDEIRGILLSGQWQTTITY